MFLVGINEEKTLFNKKKHQEMKIIYVLNYCNNSLLLPINIYSYR